ncbi:unnamed protein product [Effrenium voratum]|uniref:Uncharacterized protein n=1 Tax=Effrenium voratum TaxID=2562239 RepID=A0AA36I5C5_9DINO|nr:unnamed protein product [Effrenium voratum]
MDAGRVAGLLLRARGSSGAAAGGWELCLAGGLHDALGPLHHDAGHGCENLGQHEKLWQFANLHYTLAALQIFGLGTLLSVNGLGAGSVEELAVNGTSAGHLAWGTSLLLSSSERLFLATGLPPAANETSPALQAPRCFFTEMSPQVLFIARQGSEDGLWAMDVNNSLRLVHSFGQGLVQSVQLVNSSLAIEVLLPQCGAESRRRLLSDGLSVQGDAECGRPTQGSLLGQLFLASLPASLLSALLCARWPGLTATLFLGLYSIVVVIRLLADADLSTLHEFLYTSFTIYSTLALLAVILLHTLRPGEDWEQVKAWSSCVAGVGFFAAIQLRLDVPFAPDAWRWVVFGVLGLLQLVLGQLLERRLLCLLGLAALQLAIGKGILEATALLGVGFAAYRALQLGFLGLSGAFLLTWDAVPEDVKVQPELPTAPEPAPAWVEEAAPAPAPPKPKADAENVALSFLGGALAMHANILKDHQREPSRRLRSSWRSTGSSPRCPL